MGRRVEVSKALVERYHPHDFAVSARRFEGGPFPIELAVDFEHESGERIEGVPGFHNGEGEWVVRFAPALEGRWSGRISSGHSGLDGVALGPVECVGSDNPRVHGLLGTDPKRPNRFAWRDGTKFVPLGFECDWLFAYHQKDPEACRAAIDRIAERGFNYIVMNVYAHAGFSDTERDDVLTPPNMFLFGGTNEKPDHALLNVDFFRDFDALISYLHGKGIVAHLMLQVQNKHVNWPPRRSPEDDMFWRYVVSRYQAFGNIVWDAGKESYNLLKETGGHDYTLERIDLIRRTDAFGHLVTVHDPAGGSAGVNSVVDDACDFVSDQVHLGDTALYNHEAIRRFRSMRKPYMNIEYGYEEGVEPLKTYSSRTTGPWQDILLWTWAIYLGGGYPCYYYNNTAWDLVKFEPEPPGWKRCRFMMDFLDAFDLNAMSPDNELVKEGFCLAEPGRQYLVLLPEGGDLCIDLTALPDDAVVECEWMDIHSGGRKKATVEGRGFAVGIGNPFGDAAGPCAVSIIRR